MAIEAWIDQIAQLAGEVEDARGGHVVSYQVFGRDNFPDGLSYFPCAITYPIDCVLQYSDSGPFTELWRGITEFHITPDEKKQNFPYVLAYFARIRNAFALHRTLGGRVAYCMLRTDEPSLSGPVVLSYGAESPHLGIIARWIVKEDVSGDFTLGV